jgi:glycosyltransferase involved in cell wall biosynthesis
MNRPTHAARPVKQLGRRDDVPRYSRDPRDIQPHTGAANMLTIVAISPLTDPLYAGQLAEAYTLVRRRCMAQLVLLGTGPQRSAVMRRVFACGLGADVHLRNSFPASRWSDSVAAADVVAVPSIKSGPTNLLEVMAVGRAVVAPVDPASVRLVLPTSAGLLYRPGDVYGMATALLRILTSPTLRHGMGCRAAEVARRHRQTVRPQRPEKRKEYA